MSVRVIFAPAAGLLAGYAVWLAICAAIIGTVPVSAWALSMPGCSPCWGWDV